MRQRLHDRWVYWRVRRTFCRKHRHVALQGWNRCMNCGARR